MGLCALNVVFYLIFSHIKCSDQIAKSLFLISNMTGSSARRKKEEPHPWLWLYLPFPSSEEWI